MNGKTEEEKQFCTECMRIINQVYERYEKGELPEPVDRKSRKGPFRYTTYSGEVKVFAEYNDFLFNYGKDCYYAAKSFYDNDDKMKDALVYIEESIKVLEKWSTKNEPPERIELAQNCLKMARIYKGMVEEQIARFKKTMEDAPWASST